MAPQTPADMFHGGLTRVATEWKHAGLIAAAALLVYANTFDNAFHIDDMSRIVDNTAVRSIFPVSRFFTDYHAGSTAEEVAQYRPLLPFSNAVNYAISGLNTWSYHLFNILLLIFTSLIAYGISIELLAHWREHTWDAKLIRDVALAIGLLFALHPVSGLTVNYICSRDEMMMTMFFLAAFLWYVRIRRKGGKWYDWLAVVLLHLSAMMSKGDGITLPAIIVCFELLVARSSRKHVLVGGAVFTIAPAIFFLITNGLLHFSDFKGPVDTIMPWYEYAGIQLAGHLFHYARNFILPMYVLWGDISESEPPPNVLQVVLGAACITATFIIAWRERKRNPIMSFCILAYWITLSPTSSIVPFWDRFQDYRPLPGMMFMLLAVVPIAIEHLDRRVWKPVAAAVILAVAVCSILVNNFWLTDTTFWTRATELGDSWRAHMNLAAAIVDRNDEAIDIHLHKALQLEPNRMYVLSAMGSLLIERGDTPGGIALCEQAASLMPQWGPTYLRLANAYDKAMMPEQAQAAIERALQIDPSNRQYQLYAAKHSITLLIAKSIEQYHAKQYEEVVKTCGQILLLDSTNVIAYVNITAALNSLKRWDEARAAGEQALRLDPTNLMAKGNLDWARSHGNTLK